MLFSDLINWKCETCFYKAQEGYMSPVGVVFKACTLSFCFWSSSCIDIACPIVVSYLCGQDTHTRIHSSSCCISLRHWMIPQVHFLQCCQDVIHCKQFKQLYVNLYKYFIQTAPAKPLLGCASAGRACTGHISLWQINVCEVTCPWHHKQATAVLSTIGVQIFLTCMWTSFKQSLKNQPVMRSLGSRICMNLYKGCKRQLESHSK